MCTFSFHTFLLGIHELLIYINIVTLLNCEVREVQLPLAQSNGMMDYGSHFNTSSSAFMT